MDDSIFKTLNIVKDNPNITLQNLIKKMPSKLTRQERRILVSDLDKDKLISYRNSFYNITSKGNESIENHYQKINIQSQSEDMAFEKLKYDLENVKRTFRHYKYIFWMAVFSFIVSLVLAILRITEAFVCKPL